MTKQRSVFDPDYITPRIAHTMIEIALREAGAGSVAGAGAGRRIGVSQFARRPVTSLRDEVSTDASKGMGSKGVPMGASLSERGRVNQPKQMG